MNIFDIIQLIQLVLVFVALFLYDHKPFIAKVSLIILAYFYAIGIGLIIFQGIVT